MSAITYDVHFCLHAFTMVFQKEVLKKKVLLILAYFIVVIAMLIARSGINELFEEALWSSIRDYFLCEAVGHVEGKCSRESFEKYLAPLLEGLLYIMVGLFPVVYLLFVVNLEQIFARVKEIVHIHCTKSTKLSSNPEAKDHCKCQDWLTAVHLLFTAMCTIANNVIWNMLVPMYLCIV